MTLLNDKSNNTLASAKSNTRDKVWLELLKVARPDSRHHYDFSSFIADFHGSENANRLLMTYPAYKQASTVFITPDNCLEDLRFESLKAGKRILITTYAIRRGFWLLDPALIQPEDYRYAATLDGMERVGQPISLAEIRASRLDVQVMVTGTGAINHRGVRFGKGHGFFDLEWAMLSSVGVVQSDTLTVAVVHDCQVLDEELLPEDFDTVCDVIVTPSGIREISSSDGAASKPSCGIIWNKLQPNMLNDIPPLQELKRMEES